MAVNAFVAQNIAISAFNNNENALQAINDSWAGLKLAIADTVLELFNTLLAAEECASAIDEAAGSLGAAAVAAGTACAAAVIGVVNFAFAVDAAILAGDSYTFACEDQLTARDQLIQARYAATVALDRALAADQKGGVK
jgi:hypothetical protein